MPDITVIRLAEGKQNKWTIPLGKFIAGQLRPPSELPRFALRIRRKLNHLVRVQVLISRPLPRTECLQSARS